MINQRLKDAVTQTAFSLTLSQPQITALSAVYKQNKDALACLNSPVVTIRKLEGIGLIVRNQWSSVPMPYYLTISGEHVVNLLISCGMIESKIETVESIVSNL